MPHKDDFDRPIEHAEHWVADPEKKGSVEPMEGRCGGKISKSDPTRYCTQFPIPGSGTTPGAKPRCKFHGGMSVRGTNHWTYKQGRSRSMTTAAPEQLQALMKTAMDDQELMDLRESVALLSARLTQTVSTLNSFESIAAWGSLQDRIDDIEKNLETSSEDDIRAALEDIRELAINGVEDYKIWQKDIFPAVKMHKELIESDAKQRKYLAQAMSIEQAIVFKELLLRAIHEEVKDAAIKRKIGLKMANLLRGSGQDIQVPGDLDTEGNPIQEANYTIEEN